LERSCVNKVCSQSRQALEQFSGCDFGVKFVGLFSVQLTY
jgi:hypothetical protein